MPGFFERERVGQGVEYLAYKTPVEAVVNGQKYQGTVGCDVHFGTDGILEEQRHYAGYVRTLQGIAASGKDFFDLEPRENRAINFLLQSQHCPITGSPENISIQLQGMDAVRHIENTFADPAVLKKIYGNITYWKDRHQGLRPREPISTQFRLKYVRRTLHEERIISIDAPIVHGLQKNPQELWEFELNYLGRNIYINHKFLTYDLSPEEAIKFINDYEATDVKERIAAFLHGLEGASSGVLRFPSLHKQLHK